MKNNFVLVGLIALLSTGITSAETAYLKSLKKHKYKIAGVTLAVAGFCGSGGLIYYLLRNKPIPKKTHFKGQEIKYPVINTQSKNKGEDWQKTIKIKRKKVEPNH